MNWYFVLLNKLSGTVLESSGRADSNTVHGFDNWPRFVGVIEQNKISNSFCHYCITSPSVIKYQVMGERGKKETERDIPESQPTYFYNYM